MYEHSKLGNKDNLSLFEYNKDNKNQQAKEIINMYSQGV